MTGRVSSAPANSFTPSMESNRSKVTNSTSLPFSRINNSEPWYPEVFRTDIIGEIASARLETRFRHAHDVVMRHHFLRTVIRHRDDAAAVRHQRRDLTGKRD